MKLSSLLIITLFVVLAGCDTPSNEVTVSPTPSTPEIEARSKKIPLSAAETASLKHALSGTSTNHLDVDSKGDQLVFGSDRNSSHASAADQTIKSRFNSSPVPIAATPAARITINTRGRH
jgi:hypothetical protein